VPVRSGSCFLCGGPLDAELRSIAGNLPVPCLDCQESIRSQNQVIGGYQLVRELGRGAMGVVYLALRLADGYPVALKTVVPAAAGSSGQIDRFLREADILRQLDHTNIVAFRDMGRDGDTIYFAMDYIRGTDASKVLRKEKKLAVGRAVDLVSQLLDALSYAHTRRFVHRDIKPSNMLVTEVNGREVVKLADFGLARVYQASQLSGMTMTGDIGGTVAFMPPEQITEYREAKPHSDQYAAAATLYNLLTGAYIYDLPKEFQKQLLMILNDDPVPIGKRRRDLPAGLVQVIHKALAREPSGRFGDVNEMKAALGPFRA
jgi:serine/threonine-protein kinase